MKKLITVAFCLVACFCLNGCNLLPQPAPVADPNDSIAETMVTEAAESSAAEQSGPTAAEVSDMSQGFFVKTADGSFVPLVNKTPEFNVSLPDTMIYTGQFMWCTDEVFESIPVVKTDESTLVYFQDSSNVLLNSPLVLERLTDKGYTIGITFYQPGAGDPTQETTVETTAATETEVAEPTQKEIKSLLFFDYPMIFPGSSAAEVFAGELDLDAYVFTAIDTKPIEPNTIPPYTSSYFNSTTLSTKTPEGTDTLNTNLLGASGVLENLVRGQEYTLDGYKGTTAVSIKMKADLRCMTPVFPFIPLNPLDAYILPEDLSEKYCTVKFPDDLVEGYYILNGSMVFYLENGVKEQTTEPTPAA